LQFGTNALEDGPQHLALRLQESGLPAEAHDIAIGFPVGQLPRIHDLFPFGKQEMQAELVTIHLMRCRLD
jgi:hypothetical protein